MTALVFDCDGVLADTERYGHLPAFNATFAEYGLSVRWTEDEYAEKLRIGGGKERMASLFADPDFVLQAAIPDRDAERRELLARWLPFPPQVEVSTVGEAAVLTGALAVGVRAALDNVAR